MASQPPLKFGGPPPGATPVGLSAMQMSPLRSSDTPGGGAGIAKLFFSLESTIDSLASIIPDQADQLDEIKSRLREVLAQAVSNGAAFTGDTTQDLTSGLRSGPQEPLL
jgi:hypothetical protein